MPVNELTWTNLEKDIARAAFDRAREREMAAIVQEVRTQAATATTIDEVWILHDFLSARRHDVDGKYDYRYSVLIFVFSRLIKEGYLHLSELDGLERDKLAKISALTRM